MKAEVVITEKPVQAKPTGSQVPCNHLTIGGSVIQDIYNKDEVLLTTACGVAPSPDLQYRCFWLRGDNVKWEIVQHNGYQILVPTRIEK